MELLEAVYPVGDLFLREFVIAGAYETAIEHGIGGNHGSLGAVGIFPQPVPEAVRVAVLFAGA